MPKSDDEVRKQIEEFCQRVLAGSKPEFLDRAAMEADAKTKGKYDQGYRAAKASQGGMRTYTMTYNPSTERIDVEYH